MIKVFMIPSPKLPAMLAKTLMAVFVGGALTFALPAAPVFAQGTDTAKSSDSDGAKTKKSKAKKDDKTDSAGASDTKAKKLTPQQQRMKDCAVKWKEEKKAKNVKGREAYRKFLSTCLKKS